MKQRFVGLLVLALAALFAARWLATREPTRNEPEVAPRTHLEPAREPLQLASDVGERMPAVARLAVASPHAPEDFDGTIAAPDTGTLRLHGSVLGGHAVGEAVDVACRDENGVHRQKRADASGRFEFSGLAPGRYALLALGRNSIARRVVDVEADTRADLALDALHVARVTVVDENGEPWAPAGVAVLVTLSDPGADIRDRSVAPEEAGTTKRADDGRPELGSWWIEGPLPVRVSLVRAGSVLATQSFGAGDHDLVFRLDRGDPRLAACNVRFRTIDGATGAPIETRAHIFGVTSLLRVDAPGGVGRAALDAGEYRLRATYVDLCATVQFRVVGGASDLDLGDVALERAPSIRGRVELAPASDEPVSVYFRRCDESGVPLEPIRTRAETAADGSFELRRLDRGFYRLWAGRTPKRVSADEAPDVLGVPAHIVDLRTADAEGVLLECPQTFELAVRPGGRETIESRFRVSTPDGTVIATRALRRRLTDVGDAQRIALAPGEYDVERWHRTDGARETVRVRIVDAPIVVDMP